MEKILLAGYMGSGKTTVGEILSLHTGQKFLDLDRVIEEIEGRSIKDIFANKGEIYFRKTEARILRKLIAGPEGFVLALGGGTPCYGNNSEVLRAMGVQSFYLQASVAALSVRLMRDKSSRPLIANIPDDDLPSFIGTHLFERNPYYRQAHHIIGTDGRTPDEIAREIVAQLSRA